MRAIHPTLFMQLMSLPSSMRTELLELLGATPVEDSQLREMLAQATASLAEKDAGKSVAAL